MTREQLDKMPIEEIIHLPNFYSLRSRGGEREVTEFDNVLQNEYWEIDFLSDKRNGKYYAFDIQTPSKYYRIFKIKR